MILTDGPGDLDEPGILEPAVMYPPHEDCPETAVICFFPGTVDAVAAMEGSSLAFEFFGLVGDSRMYVREHGGERVGFFFPEIGAPRAVMFLEEAIARGVKRFVAVGSAGVLVPELVMGHPLVVTSALRDEGTSAQYAAEGDVIDAQEAGIRACTQALEAAGLPYETGRAWTTDAIYRETRSRVARRIEQGAAVVDMEASAFIAVARFRGVELGQILWAADSLAGDEWDSRGWHTADDAHAAIFWVAMDAAARLAALPA